MFNGICCSTVQTESLIYISKHISDIDINSLFNFKGNHHSWKQTLQLTAELSMTTVANNTLIKSDRPFKKMTGTFKCYSINLRSNFISRNWYLMEFCPVLTDTTAVLQTNFFFSNNCSLVFVSDDLFRLLLNFWWSPCSSASTFTLDLFTFAFTLVFSTAHFLFIRL